MCWLILDPRRSNLGLFLGYAALGIFIGVSFVWGLLYWVFESSTDAMVEDGLWGQAEEVAAAVSLGTDGPLTVNMHEPMNWAYDAFFANLKYRVMDATGKVIFASDGIFLPMLPPGGADLANVPTFFRIPGAGGGALAVGTFRFNKAGHTLIVQTARSDRFSALAAEAMYPAVFETALVLAVGTLIIIFVAAFLALDQATRRIRDYSVLADRINPDNLNERLALNRVPAEIEPLVEAFNRALDRIEEAYRVQQRFVANAAHELKTPLSIIRTQIDLSVTPPYRARLLADIDIMTRNVQQMLHLSQVQNLRNYRFQNVSLRHLLEEVASAFEGFPPMQGKLIRVVGAESVFRKADEAILYTAVRNLVENAIRHSPEGGMIELGVDGEGIWVRDQGPGFDPEQKHLLFERFWRADASCKEGSGLGLSIVAEIARAHGGTVSAELLPSGGGSVFRLNLS